MSQWYSLYDNGSTIRVTFHKGERVIFVADMPYDEARQLGHDLQRITTTTVGRKLARRLFKRGPRD